MRNFAKHGLPTEVVVDQGNWDSMQSLVRPASQPSKTTEEPCYVDTPALTLQMQPLQHLLSSRGRPRTC
ncbi:TPA: hypothetical protein ACH3X1_013876 [Trebouxia sp. C0004]